MKNLYMVISKNLLLNLDRKEWISYLVIKVIVDLFGNVKEWIILCK